MPNKTTALGRRLARWLRGDDPQNELAHLGRVDIEQIARDLAMSADELMALHAKGPDASRQLHERFAALGLTGADIERVAHGLMRDLERTCAYCADKGMCNNDLAARPDDEGWKNYCPNAPAITAAAGTKGRFPI